MDEDKFQAELAVMRRDWGSVSVDPNRPGIVTAANDPMTGMLVGRFAPLVAEIVNRALAQ